MRRLASRGSMTMPRFSTGLLALLAALPAAAQGILPNEPNTGPAWLLRRQTDELALRPGERRSGLSLLERDQVIMATRGRIPGILIDTALDPSGTTWTVSARLPETR
jgi:hypothetical protein